MFENSTNAVDAIDTPRINSRVPKPIYRPTPAPFRSILDDAAMFGWSDATKTDWDSSLSITGAAAVRCLLFSSSSSDSRASWTRAIDCAESLTRLSSSICAYCRPKSLLLNLVIFHLRLSVAFNALDLVIPLILTPAGREIGEVNALVHSPHLSGRDIEAPEVSALLPYNIATRLRAVTDRNL